MFFIDRLKALLAYLGVHLIIGLIISLICLAVFGKIADSVMEQETLYNFDVALANNLHDLGSSTTTDIFLFISLFGQQLLWVLVAGIVLYYIVKRDWWRVGIWVYTLVGGELMNRLVKEFFQRARPTFAEPFIIAQDFSFPSGHAMLSLIVYGMLAYTLCLHFRKPWQRILIIFACALLVILIGISRLYLGVHYFSDIVGGFAAGAVWLFTCITAAEVIRRKRYTVDPTVTSTAARSTS